MVVCLPGWSGAGHGVVVLQHTSTPKYACVSANATAMWHAMWFSGLCFRAWGGAAVVDCPYNGMSGKNIFARAKPKVSHQLCPTKMPLKTSATGVNSGGTQWGLSGVFSCWIIGNDMLCVI